MGGYGNKRPGAKRGSAGASAKRAAGLARLPKLKPQGMAEIPDQKRKRGK